MRKKLLILSITIGFVLGFTYHESKDIDYKQLARLYLAKTTAYSKSDIEYKKEIIQDSNNKEYTLESMQSIAGPEELKDFITKNNLNPQMYIPSANNIKNGDFRANFHIHTTSSDGTLTIEQLLNQAELYAEKIHKPFYFAITDHNTVNGLKTAVDLIEKHPDKYKNIKLVLGMEVFSSLEANPKIMQKPIDIHVLCWCINPYDKELNQVFMKKDLKDKYNYSFRTFENAIILLNHKGIVGIAHPMRYVKKDNLIVSKDKYYDYLINKYFSLNSKNTLFTEGYYQSYDNTEEKELINQTNTKFKEKGLILTGSTDAHGKSIFNR